MHNVHADKQTYILPESLSLRNCWCIAFIFCSRICIFWQLGRDQRLRVQRLPAVRTPPQAPPPRLPLLTGQRLGNLGLLDLQVVQATLELTDPCSVYWQVLVDLRGQRPRNHVWVGLWPLILDYKLGHSCQCKHLGRADGRRLSTAAELSQKSSSFTHLFAHLFK